MRHYLKRATEDTLMNDYFYVESLSAIEEESSKDTISNGTISLSKYMVDIILG